MEQKCIGQNLTSFFSPCAGYSNTGDIVLQTQTASPQNPTLTDFLFRTICNFAVFNYLVELRSRVHGKGEPDCSLNTVRFLVLKETQLDFV